MNSSTYEQIVSLIAQAAQRDAGSISPHDHLIEDLEFDSLELAELIALLQETFSIAASRICEPGCLTVSQIVARVERQRQRPRAA